MRAGASRLRIAHILPFPGVGGTEIATVRLARAAASHGHENVVFHLNTPEAGQFFSKEGLETAIFGGIQPSLRHPGSYLEESRSLAAEFSRRRISLIHGADWLGAYFTSLAAWKAGIPIITHVRGRYDRIPWRDSLFLTTVRHFVFVSKETWKRFDYRVPPDKATVLYDGIAVEQESNPRGSCRASVLAEWNLPPDTFLVGMVARVSPEKDFITLVDAGAQVVSRYPHARFLMVGDYDSSHRYRQFHIEVRRHIAARKLDSHFIFTGFRKDVPRMLYALDLFVLCTLQEGFPLVILEAMGCAKPVVATAVDGIPEIVIPGQTGLLHKKNDSEDLARQILQLMENPELLRKLSNGGLQLVASEFSSAKFNANVGSLYAKVLGR
ncbi:MAG TPA: glycosyltransferase [Bryobacteraceae bacterium]|nr:glycosyltransferase [Bryobacteraceae bacterium]